MADIRIIKRCNLGIEHIRKYRHRIGNFRLILVLRPLIKRKLAVINNITCFQIGKILRSALLEINNQSVRRYELFNAVFLNIPIIIPVAFKNQLFAGRIGSYTERTVAYHDRGAGGPVCRNLIYCDFAKRDKHRTCKIFIKLVVIGFTLELNSYHIGSHVGHSEVINRNITAVYRTGVLYIKQHIGRFPSEARLKNTLPSIYVIRRKNLCSVAPAGIIELDLYCVIIIRRLIKHFYAFCLCLYNLAARVNLKKPLIYKAENFCRSIIKIGIRGIKICNLR